MVIATTRSAMKWMRNHSCIYSVILLRHKLRMGNKNKAKLWGWSKQRINNITWLTLYLAGWDSVETTSLKCHKSTSASTKSRLWVIFGIQNIRTKTLLAITTVFNHVHGFYFKLRGWFEKSVRWHGTFCDYFR